MTRDEELTPALSPPPQAPDFKGAWTLELSGIDPSLLEDVGLIFGYQ